MPRRGHGNRMPRAWSALSGISIAFTSNSTANGGALNFTTPSTIVRILGEYTASLAGTLAANDEAVVTVGIGIVSTDASALGATALPDPGDEPEYPWLYWAAHDLSTQLGAATDNLGNTFVRQRVDVKGQRKIRPGQSLKVVAQYQDSVGTPPIDLEIAPMRVLFLF